MIFALLIGCGLVSCGDDEEKVDRQGERISKSLFYQESPTLTLQELKNEMAEAPTDLLRREASSPIPWQLWRPEILQTAGKVQEPILLVALSAHSGDPAPLLQTLQDRETISKMLKDHYVCSLVDTHAYPEIGDLSYHLSALSQEPVAFPMLIWLSPEGAPLTWRPLRYDEPAKVEQYLQSCHATIADLWTNSQGYSVENSRAANDRRQEVMSDQLRPAVEDVTLPHFRTFTRGSRRLSSLYNPLDQNLDGLGGLLPSTALRLLTQAAWNPDFTSSARKQARTAVLGTTRTIIKSGVKDYLEGGYFHARLGSEWELPLLVKDFQSQVSLALSLLEAGASFEEEKLFEEGKDVLAQLENGLLGDFAPVLIETSHMNADLKNTQFFEYSVLEEILSSEELSLARTFFGILPEGNLDSSLPRQVHRLNTLRPVLSPAKAAAKLSLSLQEFESRRAALLHQVRDFRRNRSPRFQETALPVSSLALFGQAQLARFQALPTASHLAAARSTAARILQEFMPEDRLARLPGKVFARGIDYAQTCRFFLSLHQATLEAQWLETAVKLANEAVTHLKRPDLPLKETPDDQRVIPLEFSNFFMIFGESTLGIFDLVLGILNTLEPTEDYQRERNLILHALGRQTHRDPVPFCDFLLSCSLPDHPFLLSLREPGSATHLKLLSYPLGQKIVLSAASPSQGASVQISRAGKVLATFPDALSAIDYLEAQREAE